MDDRGRQTVPLFVDFQNFRRYVVKLPTNTRPESFEISASCFTGMACGIPFAGAIPAASTRLASLALAELAFFFSIPAIAGFRFPNSIFFRGLEIGGGRKANPIIVEFGRHACMR